jgi:hypothetical protein
MRSEAFKNQNTQDKEEGSEDPKIKCILGMLPKRDMVNQTVPVTVHNIKQRVQSEKWQYACRYTFDLPEYGSEKE